MSERMVGTVTNYFSKVGVAAIELESSVKTGDTLHFKGAHTDFTQPVESMQVEHETVEQAGAGSQVGIKVSDRVRPGDSVLLVTE